MIRSSGAAVPALGLSPVPRKHRWAALVVLCAAALIVNVDNTILNVALPTLVRKLAATSSELQWIVDSYAMVFAGLLLVGGSLADRFGRKRFFLIGLGVFGAGSVGAAFSGSVDLLIGWRAVMGAGAALTIPASLSIVNDLFRDPAERARAIGAWAATIGLGIAIGPIAGGRMQLTPRGRAILAPHHRPPPDQQVHRPGERGADRSRTEHAQADEEEPLAPEPVSQAAADQQQAREDHRVRVDDPLQLT